MTSSIFNSWGELKTACNQVLVAAQHSLCIFDGDLSCLGLSQSENMSQLHRLVSMTPAGKIRIALKQTDHLHRDYPLLVQFCENFSHVVQIQQVPEHLYRLRDSLVIADSLHVLARFDQDHPRSKLIVFDKQESAPYCKRFEDIWNEGGYPFSPTTLGL